MKQTRNFRQSAGRPDQPMEPNRSAPLDDHHSGEAQGPFQSDSEMKAASLQLMDEMEKTNDAPLRVERIVDIIKKVKRL